jgi:hypothetical protein
MRLTRHLPKGRRIDIASFLFFGGGTILEKKFQWSYTSALLGIVSIGTLVGSAATYYFINQNYEIFLQITAQYAPQMIANLASERQILNQLIGALFFGTMIFYLFVSMKMSSRIIAPVLLLQKHMKKFLNGHLQEKPIRIRESDEFHDLIETYNYLYDVIKTQTQTDLDRLKSLKLDQIMDPRTNACVTWKRMIKEKSEQLQINETFSSLEPTRDSHRAS